MLIDALWCLRTAANEYRKNDVLSSTKHGNTPIINGDRIEKEMKKMTLFPKGQRHKIFQK